MDVCLSHTSALEVMRDEGFAELVASWDDAVSAPPDRLPAKSELERVLGEVGPTPHHVLVSSDRSGHAGGVAHEHVARMRFPRGSFLRVGPDLLVCCPELVCIQMASVCGPYELVLLVSELCGTYIVLSRGLGKRVVPLTSRERIASYMNALGPAHGVKRLREALAIAVDGAASPMEAKTVLRFTLPPCKGGYGFRSVSMNEEFSLRKISELRAFQIRKPDLLFLGVEGAKNAGVCLDYDGGGHLTARQAAVDSVRSNELIANGFRPYKINKENYDSLDYMDALARTIARDIGIELSGMSRYKTRRERLYDVLERIDGQQWRGL